MYKYTTFSSTEITCLGFKALGENVLMPADLRSSLQYTENPLLEMMSCIAALQRLWSLQTTSGARTSRTQELSMCLVEKENTQLQYKFQRSNCLGSLT